MKSKEAKIISIIKILKKNNPHPHTVLNHKNPFQLLVATILSAQCTDERVNKITPLLFEKYRGIRDFAKANQTVLEKEIHSTGFYKNKAKNIISLSQKIINDFNGRVPDDMEKLVTLPGVARKTANILLSSWFKKAQGIAVDTHVKRLSERLGLSDKKNPDKIEQDIMKIVPRKEWLDFNYLLVEHGRNICNAKKPLCLRCPIKNLCPSGKKFYKER